MDLKVFTKFIQVLILTNYMQLIFSCIMFYIKINLVKILRRIYRCLLAYTNVSKICDAVHDKVPNHAF